MWQSFSIRHMATAIKTVKPKVKSNAAKERAIKSLNFENKSLFGAVIKDKNSHIAETSAISCDPKASEMYWLMQRRNVEKKLLKLNCVEQTSSAAIHPIPFNDNELKSILKFPIAPSENGTLEQSWTRHEQYENEHCRSPSVNKILGATMPEASRQALLRWKDSKIALLGEDGFAEFQKATFERGSNMHSCLELWCSQQSLDEGKLEKAGKLWNSIQDSLTQIERPARVFERKIYHPFLHYNGVVDCVATIDKKLHIIEWKTSENQKPTIGSTYDAPIQLCAYLGALKADPAFGELNVDGGAVFVAYTNGSPAHVHIMNPVKLKQYWTIWTQRLHEYWVRYRDNTLPEPI
ncbi:mitochondrial genome maintenance exonuclease 1-like [Toxorhynchites rutilus septentrionalis]|uniref:mitochondrial genome maintenance exonuclease 1-like n=1 Tax=Toxorhynchites rutilus septentrionalis TaxID=329112 RepID=UPI00247A016C|nr:mitochondrial genome maintenance exonuclease 1-like [Toxorhynchites rutilus septentrionalis]XP_055627253.1 mitochondrial genome maintenance exonuclease 1-like [Toxorhynchites rutilus septentrionalis]